ncbi:MAG: arsenate reductase family protein, partial [Coriobacteriaceae bacterium]|nr:arsenate reductase family protein [Coriobacteriaceae bacterium]
AGELRAWHAASGLDRKRFVNTSGMLYRQMGLKDKLPQMSDDEVFELLSTDGMLVKRPLIIDEDRGIYLTGFREEEWERALL